MPTDDGARIARLEERMAGHEALCTERWRELRDDVGAMRTTQAVQHSENSGRLKKIEETSATAAGNASGRASSWAALAAVFAGICAFITAIATLIPAIPWHLLFR